MRVLAFILLFLFATPAHAQFGFGGDVPIEVDAERATYKGGLTVLEENVRVTQDDTTVESDRMEIYRDTSEGDNSAAGSLKLGAITRIEAEGNFRFTNPDNTVTGDAGTYFADRRMIVVTGNVVLTQPGGNTVTGNRLVYNLDTGSARFGTPCQTGTAARGTKCDRVTVTLQ